MSAEERGGGKRTAPGVTRRAPPAAGSRAPRRSLPRADTSRRARSRAMTTAAAATARPRAAEADAASGPLFELDPRYVNLTTFVLASHPRPVREAIERHRRKLDENTALYLRESEVALEEAARVRARRLPRSVKPDEIALTDSTTMGVALVVRAPEPRTGRGGRDHRARLLRHPRVAAAARAARRRDGPAGAPVRRAGVGVGRRIVSAVSRALGPRTRALALTWVHSSSGVKLPLREIAAAVADANRGRRERERILLCVDGVHGFGAEDASPADLGIDVLVVRLPQVAVRPARHRLRLGRAAAPGAGSPPPSRPSTRASTARGSRAARLTTRRPAR